MAITALPTTPSRADAANFADRGDAFLGALPTFQSEANALATDVNAKQVTASTAATTATTQAGIATTQAGIATTQAGLATTQAGNALTSANNAEASFDSFDDRYLGAKTSDPTLDNDGDALLTGALYFNSVVGEMRVYSGSVWVAGFLPEASFVTLNGTQTLTNKTIDASTNTIIGVGDVTLAGTQTLTNKTISGSSNTLTVDGTNEIGFRNIPQNSRSLAYTLVLDDAGKHIFHPSADTTARTFTIPANSSVAYPIGTAITFINQNGTGGIVTIAITSDTMRLSPAGTTGSRTLARNGSATCIKVTATEWLISGSGLT